MKKNQARRVPVRQYRLGKGVRITIVVAVIALLLWPLMAMVANAQPLIAVRVITTPKPELFWLDSKVSEAQVYEPVSKVAGNNEQARFIFADAAHGDGRDNGVFSTFTVNDTQLVTFGILPNTAGTKFVSDFSVSGNQLHSLNYNSEWTIWDYDPTFIQLSRKPNSSFGVPATAAIVPLTKRSAVFAGYSGNLFEAKVTSKGNASTPPLDKQQRTGMYTQTIAFSEKSVYLFDPSSGAIISYARDKRGRIDPATKVLVAYDQYVAALSVLGDDLYAISCWFDDDGNWHGQLIVMRNAALGNAVQEVLDNDVPADFDSWIGNAFAVANLNGQPVVALVAHEYSEYGPNDSVILWRAAGQQGWTKILGPDINPGAYITAIRSVN